MQFVYGHLAGFAFSMDGFNMPIHSLTAFNVLLMHAFAIDRGRFPDSVERRCHLLHYSFGRNIGSVKVDCDLVQPDLLKALENYLQGSSLLRNE